tara:strand:- start:152 stop:655 length:504 start_codon:yes stop_codon:yes gene_type:complete
MAKETSNIEMLKRQNYFDLKRDEFMALEEYLRSPISEQDLRKKADGGMMDINQMLMPIGYREGGFENRLSMLRESMRDDEEKTMKEPNITGVAFKIAEDQGDTSQENINLIVKQLGALIPSLMKTVEDETTPMLSKGIRSLLDKLSVMFGQKSDPKERRDVGFGRVD